MAKKIRILLLCIAVFILGFFFYRTYTLEVKKALAVPGQLSIGSQSVNQVQYVNNKTIFNSDSYFGTGTSGLPGAITAQGYLVLGIQGTVDPLAGTAGYQISGYPLDLKSGRIHADGASINTYNQNNQVEVVGNTRLGGNVGIGNNAPTSVSIPLFIKDDVATTLISLNKSTNAVNLGVSATALTLDRGITQSGNYKSSFEGNVGISSTDPQAKLDIGGTSSKIQNQSGNIQIIPSGHVVVTQGNVGIGSLNPGQKLDVTGAGVFSTGIKANNVAIGGSPTVTGCNNFTDEICGNGNLWLGAGTGGNIYFEDRVATEILTDKYLLVDNGNTNSGTAPDIYFGAYLPGEGIGSNRTTATNQYGLDFYTSYTKRMSITNAGNVGIGTTNPEAQLHLYKASTTGLLKMGTATKYFEFFNTGTGNDLNVAGGDLFIEYDKTHNVNFGNGSLLVGNNGNIGIGVTSNPNRKLFIEGEGSGIYLNNGNLIISMDRGSYLSTAPIFAATNSNLYASIGGPAGNAMSVYGTSSDHIYFNAGNVGIGTSSAPASPLHIYKSIAGSANLINITNADSGTNTSNWLQFGNDSSSNIMVVGVRSSTFTNQENTGFLWLRANSNLQLGTNNTEKVRITASGELAVTQLGGSGHIRMINNNNIAVLERNDGSTFYWLTTDAGNPWGTWNANRPLSFSLTTGYVGIGGAPGSVPLTVQTGVNLALTGPFAGANHNSAWTTNYASQSIVTSIYTPNGAIVGARFFTQSDQRLKKNIQPLDPKLVKLFLEKSKPVYFNWTTDNTEDTGFIAQDLLKSGLGYLVSAVPDDNMKETTVNGVLSPKGHRYVVKYEAILPILTQVAKNQQEEIIDQKKLITSLADELSGLSLNSSGDLNITETDGKYNVYDSKTKVFISRISTFAELVVAKIRAGLIETKKLIINGVDIMKKITELENKINEQQKKIEILQREIKELQKSAHNP